MIHFTASYARFSSKIIILPDITDLFYWRTFKKELIPKRLVVTFRLNAATCYFIKNRERWLALTSIRLFKICAIVLAFLVTCLSRKVIELPSLTFLHQRRTSF